MNFHHLHLIWINYPMTFIVTMSFYLFALWVSWKDNTLVTYENSMFFKSSKKHILIYKEWFIITCVGIISFYGARIGHAFIERPILFRDLKTLFTRFDGMTLNGALLFGSLALYVLIKLLLNIDQRKNFCNRIYWLAPFGFGLLKIDCFIKGCCWGKICLYPWSYTYSISKVMPWVGIPVHPVQIYDAIGGFFISFFIFTSQRKKIPWNFLNILLFLYSTLRFSTEFLRGDELRISNLALHLSVSQWVSILILFYLFTQLIYLNFNIQRYKPSYKFYQFILIFGISFLLTCCGFNSQFTLPSIPTQTLDYSNLEIKNSTFVYNINTERPQRNLFLIIGDEVLYKQFNKNNPVLYSQLKQLLFEKYNFEPSLEQIIFWSLYPKLKNIYNKIFVLSNPSIRFDFIQEDFKSLEDLHSSYDLIILTHGAPGALSVGSWSFFLSSEKIKKMNLRLTHLNTVYMQSCYGLSLAKDWLNQGARRVIGFEENTKNFIFPFFLIDELSIMSKSTQHEDFQENVYWETILQNSQLKSNLFYQDIETSKFLNTNIPNIELEKIKNYFYSNEKNELENENGYPHLIFNP